VDDRTVGAVTGPQRELIAAIRTGLAAAGDPDKAPGMQAYMKSAMPYHGVPAPGQRRLFRAVFAAHPLPDRERWLATVRALWDDATHREERYAAIALAGARAYARWQAPDLVPGLYRDLIVTGAWWDYVDDVAIHRVGPLLHIAPEPVTPIMKAWSASDDLWLRRAAIICQIGRKAYTNTALLALTIDRAADEREFFLRKAIGWALREYAKTDPDWVRGFVADRAGQLSPLSVREATKHLGPTSPAATP
jgi:3-methyladenine DNA glycosylase AlkD